MDDSLWVPAGFLDRRRRFSRLRLLARAAEIDQPVQEVEPERRADADCERCQEPSDYLQEPASGRLASSLVPAVANHRTERGVLRFDFPRAQAREAHRQSFLLELREGPGELLRVPGCNFH